ncbi:hypothetical protein BDZ89DRAFT_1128121 [Hymenopellis radicata]|nr:hypothetical protein BDZ89DRAFT_1128121 [Hymenopellis radicata]
MADIYHLPDVLKAWPWPRSINPNYEVCHAESLGWCQTFSEALSPADLLALKRSDFSRLASLTYPLLNEATVFVIEEYSDTASKDVVRHRMDSIKDALRNPLQPRPAGEWVGGEFVRQFWEDAIKIVTPSVQARFLAVYEAYLDAVVEEASDRHTNRIRDVKSYFDITTRYL